MPVRTDIRKILVLGSGPIQIGQGCEFDYSGTQACVALRELGFEVALVNSNPATIMTDSTTADRVYIEPLTPESVLAILQRERPDALLPTVGGQVALNLFLWLEQNGHLKRLGVSALGVSESTVVLTEDRRAFRSMLVELGYDVIRGGVANNPQDALQLAQELSFPLVVRSSFTLGGAGGGIVQTQVQFNELLSRVFAQNAAVELVIEESIVGWKEYELEVMRDSAGTFVVVCGVENINPMGVHTGDSITCAPCLTLTDREYQQLRDQAKQIFSQVGMETGGANIQFAVHPTSGRIVVIEMNPRVSRSSALVSKATGYPIARLAAKLAAGLTLAELQNEITLSTTAAFEPSIDYVVVKIPRWDFNKYKGASQSLGVQMKSVGEVLAFGRTFRDAFQKAWRSLELGFEGWPEAPRDANIELELATPTPLLFPVIKSILCGAIQLGTPSHEVIESLHKKTGISSWFLHQLLQLVELENQLALKPESQELLLKAKQDGFTNKAIAALTRQSIEQIESRLVSMNVKPTFKMVDSCAGEFEAKTPYFYKTFDQFDDNCPSTRKKVVILGSGPNRIGQGVEFDYSCVHAVRAAQAAGYEVILINCNPETVSTDHRVSDKLFIEPLHEEDVLDILRAEKPDGVFVQFGGQSPLKLASPILAAGFKILGTSYAAIELAENRNAFGEFITKIGVNVPRWSSGSSFSECMSLAVKLGFPLLVRPSYVLGGRAMRIVWSENELAAALNEALEASAGHPVLLDRYLAGAIEFDVDLVCDGKEVFIPTLMEHVEEAGIHSGDSTSLIPCLKASAELQQEILAICEKIALQMGVCGLLNVQLAAHNGKVFVLEVNPRSSRSVPFVSKACAVPLAQFAALVALGEPLRTLVSSASKIQAGKAPLYAAKAPVFPFHKFPGVSPRLGPEMRSIGEVMGIGTSHGAALAKAYRAAGWSLRTSGKVLLLAEQSAVQSIAPALQMLTQEFSFQLGCLNNRPDFLTLSHDLVQVFSEFQQALEWARKSIQDSELAMVIFVPTQASTTLHTLADEVGALTTHAAIPFIDSVFALDAWVLALANGRNFENPSPLGEAMQL
ncbi:carbamoyl-phosphate synthase large subunit [bacterium]|nr:carbamoyl-phosphate synthase large subunit [bacterium]